MNILDMLLNKLFENNILSQLEMQIKLTTFRLKSC